MDEIRLGSRTLQPHRQLLVNGRREPIGKRALDILSVLAEAGGGIVTKDELLEAVWPGVTVEENALQVHIVALRKALGPEAERLRTIRGVGYQLALDTGEAALGGDADAGSHAPHRSDSARRDASSAVRSPTGARPRVRLAPWMLGLAALLLALAGGWGLFSNGLGFGKGDRIPVVVRMLTAEGTRDRTEAALASGITDELILRLRRAPELRVATADADGKVPGDSFADAYVVDGSIRSSGDKLRVTARLLDASGEIVWSQTFNRGLVDMFDVQEEIAAAISNALSVSFDIGTNATAYGGTDSPEAYAAYLQFAANQLNPDQRVPVRYLERALALDPDYGQALNALSVSYALRANFASTQREALALMARMDESTRRAVASNPNLWLGHMGRGYYFANRRDFRAADASFRRVAELDTGIDPALRGTLAAWALNMGRIEDAASLTASIALIEPTYRPEMHSWLTLSQGKYRVTIDAHNQREATNPGSSASLSNFVFWAYVLAGEEDAAVRSFPELGEEFLAVKANKSLPNMSPSELRRWAIERYGTGNYTQLLNAALVASHEGHPRLATDLTRLALEWPVGGFILTILWHPAFANARKTDDFKRIVADLGLVQLWRETGNWPDACRPTSATKFTCT